MIDLAKMVESVATAGQAQPRQPETPGEILLFLSLAGACHPTDVQRILREFCRLAGLKRDVASLKANGLDAAAMLVEIGEVEL